MFELAFKSRIPIIGIETDDLVNLEAVLHKITKLKVVALPSATHKLAGALYYTTDLELVTVAMYNKLLEGEHQLVVVNPDKPCSLVFDAGVLPTPTELVHDYLKEMVDPPLIEPLMLVLKGLSLKSIGEIVMLTQARTGGTLPSEVRRTRIMVSGLTQGLYSIDTAIDFYHTPERLKAWLELNKDYFLNPQVPHQLVPRGLLFEGPPGVGKSMASKAIANYFGVPLYRLDIATTLDKYQGISENRVARSLGMLEREAPCILLLDEVEKIFVSASEESGTTTRILSQLLWWLADHQARVLTVMTTNNMAAIPPELYRPGRVDTVMKIHRLVLSEARDFAGEVFKSVIGDDLGNSHRKILMEALKATGKEDFAHSEVTMLVYEVIKREKWIEIP